MTFYAPKVVTSCPPEDRASGSPRGELVLEPDQTRDPDLQFRVFNESFLPHVEDSPCFDGQSARVGLVDRSVTCLCGRAARIDLEGTQVGFLRRLPVRWKEPAPQSDGFPRDRSQAGLLQKLGTGAGGDSFLAAISRLQAPGDRL